MYLPFKGNIVFTFPNPSPTTWVLALTFSTVWKNFMASQMLQNSKGNPA